jgi:hypothetical protein
MPLTVSVTVHDSVFVVAVNTPDVELMEPLHPDPTDQVPPEMEELNCCVPDFGMVAVVGEMTGIAPVENGMAIT